ncbi:hypothetical protein [Catenulispora subtropica]|uniref:MucB/RseB N-terminal domain-containing protein n=1 Tax=Catenulispora subtropica TaxID=450798 RepID=A0ABN2T9K4_9ACTN
MSRLRWRLLTPVVVAATVVAATTFSHALRASDSPALPRISMIGLVQKVGKSQARAFSGTVRLSVDIGLPRLPKLGTDGGADPLRLLSGDHRVRVVADESGGEQRERVALLDTLSEYDIYRGGSDLWLWDSTRQLARHGTVDTLSEALLAFASPAELAKTFTGPTAIRTAVFDTDYSSGGTARVAGRDCYVLRITPNTPGTTVGAVRVAVDAATGMPLSVTVYPAGSSKPAIKAEFESVGYAADPAELRFTPPPGAKVVEETAPDLPENPVRGAGRGWTAAVAIGGVDPDRLIAGLGTGRDKDRPAPEGTAAVLAALAGTPGTPLQSYLRMMMAAGEKTPVGLVWSSRLVSLVFTPDQRLYAGFATPDSLVATVAADEAGPSGGAAPAVGGTQPAGGADPGGRTGQEGGTGPVGDTRPVGGANLPVGDTQPVGAANPAGGTSEANRLGGAREGEGHS